LNRRSRLPSLERVFHEFLHLPGFSGPVEPDSRSSATDDSSANRHSGEFLRPVRGLSYQDKELNEPHASENGERVAANNPGDI
jgi:hypothetical protein